MKKETMPAEIDIVKNKKLLMIIIALLSVYIFWGGTYLGMKIAIETIPPFIMAGTRFLIAGSILYIISRLNGAKCPSIGEWKGTGTIGALLLLGGNGVVAWAQQRVPSGIASLLIATVPLWIVLISWLGRSRKKPNTGVIIGIILGFFGIAVMVMPGGMNADKGIDTIGIIALLFAAFSWSIGSLYSRSAVLPESPLLSTAMQMIVGGILLFIASIILGDWSKLQIYEISGRSYMAMGYLILFGSIVGYNAYIWLLKNAEPSWVSTYAFVNPIVAVFLGWLLADEQLTINSLMATVIIIAAVVIITFYRDKKSAAKI